MGMEEIISHLKKEKQNYSQIKEFSKLPGIYAIFFSTSYFPFKEITPEKDEIIYIGKTESSQEKRDAKTHFKNGKTGSSTVRKSIGAMLRETYKLKPIQRNDSDYEKGRFSHFKFDENSEEKISNWMKSNLALSFYEYPKSKEKIENLEKQLIKRLIPVLNIDKNPDNPFKQQLKLLRKRCAQIAFDQESVNSLKTKKEIRLFVKKSKGKYVNLWKNKLALFQQKIEIGSKKQNIQIAAKEFTNVGNRKSYSFNLEFIDGIVDNNIGGSAVARDLASVINESSTIKRLIKKGHYKINMDKDFCLWIQKIE